MSSETDLSGDTRRDTEDKFISRLRVMPEPLFRAAVARLANGEKVSAVARWLMTQDRGKLKHAGVHALRKYLGALRARLHEQMHSHPLIDTKPLDQELARLQRRHDNDAEINGIVRQGKRDRTIDDGIKWVNAKNLLAFNAEIVREELEYLTGLERQLKCPLPIKFKYCQELTRLALVAYKVESSHTLNVASAPVPCNATGKAAALHETDMDLVKLAGGGGGPGTVDNWRAIPKGTPEEEALKAEIAKEHPAQRAAIRGALMTLQHLSELTPPLQVQEGEVLSVTSTPAAHALATEEKEPDGIAH